MSIFINKDSRVVYQGFTGQHATFHAEEAIKHGTNIVGGVTPGKGGIKHLDRPVFDTVSEAVKEAGADVSGIFVPPQFAADAILEAIEAGIKIIVVIADGIPIQDMVRVKRYLVGYDTMIFGPNTAGVITPEECKVGIMPSNIYKPGRIGVVSRSGTLNYEAVAQMTDLGMGQSTSVGIGGAVGTGISLQPRGTIVSTASRSTSSPSNVSTLSSANPSTTVGCNNSASAAASRFACRVPASQKQCR